MPVHEFPTYGISVAEVRRLQRLGLVRTYGGTQPVKKRYLYNAFEVIAALKKEKPVPSGRLNFNAAELFSSYNIPSSLAI